MTSSANRRPDDAELARLMENVKAKGGRTLLRSEVLAWNLRWSDGDKTIVARQLDRVGAVRFRSTAGDGYVRCVNPHDRVVMVIAPGYLLFPRAMVNQDCAPDWPGIALSTFGIARSAAPVKRAKKTASAAKKTSTVTRPAVKRLTEPEPTFCPRCFLQMTTAGVCPSCD